MASYAVIKTGGKQHRVAPDDVICIEKIAGEEGDQVPFPDVLMLADGEAVTIGAPRVDGAVVYGEILEQRKGDKIVIFKKRPRTNYRRKKGHRQLETWVKITAIAADGKAPKAAKKAKPKDEPAPADVKAEAKADKPKPAKKAEAPAEAAALFAAPEGAKDDLKLIGGVGPKLEEKLNGLGITTFAQIAAFTPEDVAKVDDALSFKGRIDRDEWIDQAKELMAGGEPRAKVDKKAKADKDAEAKTDDPE